MQISKMKAIAKEFLPPIMLKSMLSILHSKRYVNSARSYSSTENNAEKGAEYYDEAVVRMGAYCQHYTEADHYPLWSVLVDRLRHTQVESVLEVGCGPGRLALYLCDKRVSHYLGFDFSPVNVEWAKRNCPEFDFVVANALETNLFQDQGYDTVICTEVLEHIERDLDVIEQIRNGTRFYGTVPNFGGKSHVRHFTSTQEVFDRYNSYFQNFSVDEFLGTGKYKDKKFYLMEGIKV